MGKTKMKKKNLITLGGEITLDVDRLIESRGIVQASSGGGKSWTLRRIFEQTFPFVQQLIIDPEGEFFTLREKFDYVYAAREGGDVVAHPLYAAKLAIKLLELKASAIIDLFEVEPRGRILFVKNFLTALTNAPKTLWHPVLIGLDEAHIFAPESGQAESLASVIDSATRGRKRGQCLFAGTQRISSLSKDVAAQLKNKLIGNTTLDIDMTRAGNDLGFDKKQRIELRKIDEGVFYAYGPAISKEVVKVKIGPVQTTHGRTGAGLGASLPAPTKKIRALLTQLSELPAEAEAEIHTLDDYRKKLQELEAELAKAKKATPQPLPAPPAKEIRINVVEPEDLEAIEEISVCAEQLNEALRGGLPTIQEFTTTLKATLARLNAIRNAPAALAPRQPVFTAPIRTQTPIAERARHANGAAASNGAGNLSKVERALLTALAQHPDGLTKGEAVMHAGYRASGDTATAFSTFAASGWMDSSGGKLQITDEGLRALGDWQPLPTGEALREQIKNSPRFSPVEKKLITVIFQTYPSKISKGDAVDCAGYRPSGDTATAFSKFVTLGYVEKMGGSYLRANPRLFE